MKNGICPKCNGTDVYTQKGSKFQSEMVTLKAAAFGKSTYPDRYICATCGYVEYYVPSEEERQLVRDSWEKVPRKS